MSTLTGVYSLSTIYILFTPELSFLLYSEDFHKTKTPYINKSLNHPQPK